MRRPARRKIAPPATTPLFDQQREAFRLAADWPADHLCFVSGCGAFGPFGFGPPNFGSPRRWACLDHRTIVMEMRG